MMIVFVEVLWFVVSFVVRSLEYGKFRRVPRSSWGHVKEKPEKCRGNKGSSIMVLPMGYLDRIFVLGVLSLALSEHVS